MTTANLPRRIDRQYYGVQYLRALAALMVLFLHATKGTVFHFGLLGSGVDLFFVLSGFLMVAITDGATRPGPFLWARMRRIVPLYWVATTVMIILFWGGISWRSPIPFWFIADYTTPVPTQLIAASYAFIPWWNEGANKPWPVLPQGWTLNLEMMLYVLFALSLYLPRRWQLPTLSITVLTLAILGILNFFTMPTLIGWANPIIIDFVVGAWIGYMWQNGWRIGRSFICLVIGMLAAVAAAIFVVEIEPKMLQFILSIPYGAMLVLVLKAEQRPHGIPRFALLLYLGNISYAIYLVQFVPITILDMQSVPRGLAFAAITIVTTLLLAAAAHRWVEIPSMQRLGQRQSAARL